MTMKRQVQLLPIFVTILFVMGFSLHLASFGQYLASGRADLLHIITPTFDAVLGAWMLYCGVLLVFGRKRFFALYDVHGWRTAVYWLITAYVTLSLPGHARYQLTHDPSYFEMFPWWFSPVIMSVYIFFCAYLLTLSPRSRTP